MKRWCILLLLVSGAFCAWHTGSASAADVSLSQSSKIRVLLVHGGHDFQTNQFLELFQQNPEITFTVAQQPQAQRWFSEPRAREYDVAVLYDMWQDISEEAQRDFVRLLQQGKGLVALHHSLCSYQKWEEYAKIIGGKYHLEQWSDRGASKPPSTYKHDVDFKVRVADPNHPVTSGLSDFTIHDETYGGFEVKPGSHILLTTDHPTSTSQIAWTTQYGRARVVYLQLGHDQLAFKDPNYRRLVGQAIRWTARGETP